MSGIGNLIKSVVGRKGTSAAGGALVSTTSSASEGVKKAMSSAMAAMGLAERDWTCQCGHKFRAEGEWYPTEPSYCEAPGCPNPTFYLDGPGRAMLEGKSSGAKSTDTKSIGGRFK
jgi:hypothetical protein